MSRMFQNWMGIIMSAIVLLSCQVASAQFDIFDFDEGEEGPWSDIENTTWIVPMVPDGSITIDGTSNSAEYGGFEDVLVTPGFDNGDIGNAWILAFAQNKNWENEADSSFVFRLAHDTDFLYVGVDAKDDVVNSDNDNHQFWKDDAIEIVVDALNDRVRNNTDTSQDRFGGHNYVNFEGRFSRWDDDLEEQIVGVWATDEDLDWTYGPDGDIWGQGDAVPGGWSMEVKFHKRQFEDPDVGNKLVEGYKMGFNIGMDDDDGQGDLEIQYWAANRAHPHEFDQFAFEDGETQADYPPEDFDWIIDAGGRLSHGGTGEIIFGPMSGDPCDFDGDGSLGHGDLNLLLAEVIARTNDARFDVNGDGTVNETDITFFVVDESKIHTWIGDANLDGEFNSGDFVQVFQGGEYEDNNTGNSTWATGDWNGDAEFDSGDFVVAFQDGGFELGPRWVEAVNVVPEPSDAVLLVCGLFIFFRRRN